MHTTNITPTWSTFAEAEADILSCNNESFHAGYPTRADFIASRMEDDHPRIAARIRREYGIGVDHLVEAGEGEDHDTGRVERLDGDMAFVAWDSGAKTPCPISDLRVI